MAARGRETVALPLAVKLERAPDDLVQIVAPPGAAAVFWLRKDGSVGGAAASAGEEEMLREAAGWDRGFVKLEAAEGSLFALHESGEVRMAGALKPWVTERLTGVVDISFYRSTLVALRKDGSVLWLGDKTSWGTDRQAMEGRLRQLDGRIARISQHRAILRDGAVSDWGSGKPLAVSGHAREFATSHGCVRLASGHWAFIGREDAGYDRWIASVRALDIVDGGMLEATTPFALKTSATEWQLWPRLDPGAPPLERFGRALRGAVQIELRRGAPPMVFALLPADTVPRSGYWTADELDAARTRKP